MSDTAIRRLTAATVLLVALIAAVVSYEHLYHLSITHGEPRLDAALIPIATDGTVVAASLVMLRAARLGLPTPWLARLMLVLAAATTLAANAAFGWSYAIWGVVLAACPVVWFIGNAESVIAFGRKTRESAPAASEPARATEGRPPSEWLDDQILALLPRMSVRSTAQALGVSKTRVETAKRRAALTVPDERGRGGSSRSPAPAAQVPAGARLPLNTRAPAGAEVHLNGNGPHG